MGDRSVQFNNAGVQILQTGGVESPARPHEHGSSHHHHVIALELFRGALDSKLAFERNQQEQFLVDSSATATATANLEASGGTGDHGEDSNPHNNIDIIIHDSHRCVTPEPSECLVQAEFHMQNLQSYLSSSSPATEAEVVPATAATPTTTTTTTTRIDDSANATAALPQDSVDPTAPHPHQWVSHVPSQHFSMRTLQMEDDDDDNGGAIAVPRQSRGYEPYIHARPFEIPVATATNTTAGGVGVSTQVISSVIVYNLGLVHQLSCRASPKAAAFYEISAALLASLPETNDTLLLRVSLLNNFGVWCFENGDGDSMRTCMEHLSMALEDAELAAASPDNDSSSCTIIHKDLKEGIRSNIQWLLTPLNGGSPAA